MRTCRRVTWTTSLMMTDRSLPGEGEGCLAVAVSASGYYQGYEGVYQID